jgi:hypothetical protein
MRLQYLLNRLIYIYICTYEEYRRNHGDAPTPDVPSRGVVVVRRGISHRPTTTTTTTATGTRLPDNNAASPLKRWNTTQEIIRTTMMNRTNASNNQTLMNSNSINEKEHDGASEEDDDDNTLATTTSTAPLRILIIGDSLAAGVGTSRSSTPILPETIAQALSMELGGRAVLWTCFGVPGQTSSEIVHSIQHLDDIFTATTKNHATLLQRFQEWQCTQRQLAQARIESAKRKTKAWMEQRKTIRNDDNSHDPTDSTTDTIHSPSSSSNNRLLRWWKRVRVQLQNDVQSLRTIWKREEIETDNIDPQVVCATSSVDGRSSTDTTMSLSEQAMMGEYDIAIVFTGLNDLKEGYLPFMRSSERTKALQQLQQQSSTEESTTNVRNDTDEAPSFNEVLKGELIRILNALLDSRMHKRVTSSSSSTSDMTGEESEETHSTSEDSDKRQQLRQQNKGPLIVFPALPYQPTIISHCAPLSWFMIPLLNMVDENKRLLAELYPGLVLYVASPDIHDWSNATTAPHGTVWEDFSVLFKLNDIAQEANERITRLMKRHYERWVIRDSSEGGSTTMDENVIEQHNVDLANDNYDIISTITKATTINLEDEYCYEFDVMGNVTIRQPPEPTPPSMTLSSLMVAADGIHPSDMGYDMWGRHIAGAIIKEWEKVG